MKTVEQDWFLQEWAASLGKVQNHLVTELGLHKNTANRIWHGVQPYRRDYVNDIAAWLNIRPFELFLHPDEANAIRRMREDAITIAHSAEQKYPPPARRTGTNN